MPPIARSELRLQIARCFNDSELRDLCFDLGIEYDDLPAVGKTSKARELLGYCIRHHRLADLLKLCRERRSSIPWPDADQVEAADDERSAKDTLLIARIAAQLQQSHDDALGDVARLELGVRSRPDLTALAGLRPERAAAPHSLAPGTTIGHEFDQAGSLLLLLGAPGAGKSTLLLRLAEELLQHFRRDPAQPIPVVLNLSAWAGTTLEAWLPTAIYDRYRIPLPLAEELLRSNKLALLLDGLDEVDAARRESCVAAISAFLRERLVPLALCCRTTEYEQLIAKAAPLAAVELQPLADEQVRAALEAGGALLASLREAWFDDTELRELLRTPLLLNVAILAFADSAVERSEQPWGRRLFPAFVVRALRRRGDKRHYPHERALGWLRWLAQTLEAQGHSELYLERIQPAWLDQALHRPLNRWIGLARGITIGGALGSIVAVVLPMLLFLHFPSLARDISVVGWLLLLCAVVMGFVVVICLVALRVARRGPLERIMVVDKLTIDPAAWRWAWLVGVVTAVIGVAWLSFVRGPAQGIVSGVALGLLLGFLVLARRMDWHEIEDALRERPNQGIDASLHNAALVSLGVGILGTISMGPMMELMLGPPFGLLGIPVGVGMSLIFWTFFGGEAYSQHLMLRAMLARRGQAPLRYISFLNYAVGLLLLRRVGGGYAFQHRLLRDYLGALSDVELAELAARARS